MQTSSRCQVKINDSTSKIEIRFSGSIDETFSMNDIRLDPSKSVEMNFAGIKSITSNGVREWIKFIATVENRDILFVECTKVFIDQVNAVHGFYPNRAVINSFYAPYFGSTSKTEKNMLFTNGKDFTAESSNIPEEITEGGEVFVLDVSESKYFKFMKSKKP